MKKYTIILICSLGIYSCSGNKQEKKDSQEEKKDLEKVETFKKTDKQKEDSVMAHWQKKMQESKAGK